jgi:hypothetical protein
LGEGQGGAVLDGFGLGRRALLSMYVCVGELFGLAWPCDALL